MEFGSFAVDSMAKPSQRQYKFQKDGRFYWKNPVQQRVTDIFVDCICDGGLAAQAYEPAAYAVIMDLLTENVPFMMGLRRRNGLNRWATQSGSNFY